MFDWGVVLKHGIPESVRFLHWRPPDLHISSSDPFQVRNLIYLSFPLVGFKTLASHLWGRGSVPGTASSGKAGKLLVVGRQFTVQNPDMNCMYWFPPPTKLPVVIWPVQCWKRRKKPKIKKCRVKKIYIYTSLGQLWEYIFSRAWLWGKFHPPTPPKRVIMPYRAEAGFSCDITPPPPPPPPPVNLFPWVYPPPPPVACLL